MGEPKQLDRAKVEEAFRLMGQYLLDRKALGEIVIYGGSAILLQFDWRKHSEDVDARIISARSHGLVVEAMHYAARQLGLSSSWLSESVAMYARRGEMESDRIFIGTYPSPERYGLRKRFWEELLGRPKVKTTRHAGLAPVEYGWIGAGSGGLSVAAAAASRSPTAR